MMDATTQRFVDAQRSERRARNAAARNLLRYQAGKLSARAWVRVELAAHAWRRELWSAETSFSATLRDEQRARTENGR